MVNCINPARDGISLRTIGSSPASSRSTLNSGFSVNLLASTAPEGLAPTITKSNFSFSSNLDSPERKLILVIHLHNS